ncbi:ATP-binding protein [Embleya sp. NBC_00896]|uniref:ATP-binding protein n=1 Tax=Embleya sp. NBC_00896 TaxID=2975961 RepID=UPI0038677BA7|nr:ATP-binding protein [Embleya sp. NBC_00896]
MKITPSARILRMLGEIEFDEWQCIAELVDNAFDDFSEIMRTGVPWDDICQVSITLPSASVKSTEAQVIIADTGRGMTYEMLEHAVRAGWSSNDRFDKLGLFGMGFNVSTARLGRRTRVLTTRSGDPEWIGVEIDLDRIGDDFEADDITEPKRDPADHGTRIEISRLAHDRAEWLRRNAANLRNILGRTYSWILDNRPVQLWVQGIKVLPRRHCRWSAERYVTHGNGTNAEKIPAYIEIDEKFADAEACHDCGNWQEPDLGRCGQCGGDRLALRERRIHGWVGIQRYLDKREFGIDFLRNGRKILQWDKRIFEWKNPNNPLANIEIEYPVDLVNQGGRLIGEIHLDHVPVTYQKNAFEYSDRSWRGAVQFLRGEGPLQPQKAKAAGYSENESPLGLLFKGYRRNAAGSRCLIPGDGKGPIHDDTRRWAQLFHASTPGYETDEKWWDAVQNHEYLIRQARLDNAQDGVSKHVDVDAVLEALGVASSSAVSQRDSHRGPGVPKRGNAEETTQERIARYTVGSVEISELSRDFGDPRLGFISVTTRRLESARLKDDRDRFTPVLLVMEQGATATAFVDLQHEIFTTFGVEVSEPLLAEIAAVLKVRADSDLNHAQLVSLLRTECLRHTAQRADTVIGEANELMAEIRSRMAASIAQSPARAFELLSTDELTVIENAMIAESSLARTDRLGENVDFLQYAPPFYLARLLESWPEPFMDGAVFKGQYARTSSLSARRLGLARTVGYVNDIAVLVSYSNGSPLQVQRTRLSVRLLAAELSETT